MEILKDTILTINKKIALLQNKETEWRNKQGGKLLDWQEYQLKQGVKDVQRLQNLVATIEGLLNEKLEKPLSKRDEILIKHHYTDKDILLKKLVHLIDTVIEKKTPISPLSITVEKKYFLSTLRTISAEYKTLCK